MRAILSTVRSAKLKKPPELLTLTPSMRTRLWSDSASPGEHGGARTAASVQNNSKPGDVAKGP